MSWIIDQLRECRTISVTSIKLEGMLILSVSHHQKKK